MRIKNQSSFTGAVLLVLFAAGPMACGAFGGSDSSSSQQSQPGDDAGSPGSDGATPSNDGAASGSDGGGGGDAGPAGSCSGATGNLLQNPSFEMGCSSGGWSTSVSGMTSAIPTKVSTGAVCGAFACRICSDPANASPGNSFAFLQALSPADSGNYHAIAYVRADPDRPAGSSPMQLSAHIDSIDGYHNPLLYGAPTNIVLDDTWTALEPPKTAYVTPAGVRLMFEGKAPGCFLIDGVELTFSP